MSLVINKSEAIKMLGRPKSYATLNKLLSKENAPRPIYGTNLFNAEALKKFIEDASRAQTEVPAPEKDTPEYYQKLAEERLKRGQD